VFQFFDLEVAGSSFIGCKFMDITAHLKQQNTLCKVKRRLPSSHNSKICNSVRSANNCLSFDLAESPCIIFTKPEFTEKLFLHYSVVGKALVCKPIDPGSRLVEKVHLYTIIKDKPSS
jgi:hypothetical protein